MLFQHRQRNFCVILNQLQERQILKKACEVLADLIDKGTFTPLPNKIRKLKRRLDKKETSYGQADNLIIALAKKYDVLNDDENDQSSTNDIDLNITPEIVITETFIG